MDEPKCEQIGMLTGGKWNKLHDISRRVYGINGLSPTLHTAGGGNTELKIIVPEPTQKGYDTATYGDSINMAYPNSKTRRGRVGHGVAQTLTTSDAQQVVIEPMTHSKQNNTDDAIDSYRFYQQAIETLKENDCEPGDTIDAYNKRVNKDGVSPTITTRPDGFKTAILPVVADDEVPAEPQKPNCRIRKLTPRECFRLMGVKREDYEAVANQQKDSSQYHLAGDSIVTACLMAILGALLSVDYITMINELVKELMQ